MPYENKKTELKKTILPEIKEYEDEPESKTAVKLKHPQSRASAHKQRPYKPPNETLSAKMSIDTASQLKLFFSTLKSFSGKNAITGQNKKREPKEEKEYNSILPANLTK